jgi:hypothetical protein
MYDDKYLDRVYLEIQKDVEKAQEKRRKLIELADKLKLPIIYDKYNQPSITIEALWEILSDETKRKELWSRLNLQVFW